jgi:NhaA family Na+:H+ antiporter
MTPSAHKGAPARRGLRHHVRTSVPRLSQFALEHLLLLPLGALIALVWVHTAPESYYTFTLAIAFWVNDVAMVFFFALMTKEVVEATIPGGVLHPLRRALLPVVASVGATAVPALIYVRVATLLDEPMLAALGWPVSLVTDLAVCFFVARLIFRSHPAVPFLLLLGIASDMIGIAILAAVNASSEHHLAGLPILAGGMAIAYGLRRARVRSFWPYLLVAGGVSWFGFFWSGLHPALALVPIMPFLPHAARDPGFFVDALPTAKDTLSRFEVWWRYPAQAALFFFGLVNAGVSIGAFEIGSLALPIAVIVGRPLGVFVGVGLALLCGLPLPHKIGWRELIVVGLIASIGFSLGLFVSGGLFPVGPLRSEMSIGVLLGLVGAPLALVAARLLRVGPGARRPEDARAS